MSAITSRPRVTGIAITANTDVVVPGAQLAEGLLRAVSSAQPSIAGTNLNTASSHRPGRVEMPSLFALRQQQLARQREAVARTAVASVHAVQLEAATKLADYVLPTMHSLAAHMRALETATTPEEARVACDALLVAAEAQHHGTFTNRIVAACSAASSAAGFSTVTSQTTRDGTIRVCATNAEGHALVTEIHATPEQEPRLETEVVGLHDGTCTDILDRFDAALEAEGVRAAAPRRSFTGGVCELAAARDFVRRKLTPPVEKQRSDSQPPAEAKESQASARRSLSGRSRQTQR